MGWSIDSLVTETWVKTQNNFQRQKAQTSCLYLSDFSPMSRTRSAQHIFPKANPSNKAKRPPQVDISHKALLIFYRFEKRGSRDRSLTLLFFHFFQVFLSLFSFSSYIFLCKKFARGLIFLFVISLIIFFVLRLDLQEKLTNL